MKTIKKTWIFQSDSSDKEYESILYTDGSTSCNCFGWCRKVQPDGSRTCKHVRAIEMNRADAQCVSSKDYSQSGPAPAPVQTKQAPKKAKSDKAIPVARKIIWD